MKRWLLPILVVLLLAGLLAPKSAAGQSGSRITLQSVVASGLTKPVTITHAGDGSGRLFVVEQTGKIKVIKNGAVLPTAFLDLTGQVSSGGEQGLLGLAFHPQYKTNGLFYIYYTDKVGVGNSVVARYNASAANPDTADPATRRQLLYVTQPYANHNAGHMAFGPDGYLYIALGDGGSGGDPLNNAQRLDTLLGKLLRIDVNSGTPYAIPPSNPFVKTSGARPEIWAYGLRNPWKFSFDRQTQDLYIGDVGQNKWEEVDFQAAGSAGGLNYGWRCMEGTHPYNSTAPCNSAAYLAQLVPPIAEYSHAEGVSVTGGVVYRGALFPDLRGLYFYGDFAYGNVWSLSKTQAAPPVFSAPVLELSSTGITISAFGEDEAGEVYAADYYGGKIRRLESINGPSPNLSGSTMQPSATSADTGQAVTFTITLTNSGAASGSLALNNPIPAAFTNLTGLTGPGSYNGQAVTWMGALGAGQSVSISYTVTVRAGTPPGSIINRAVLSGADIPDLGLHATVWTPRARLETTPNNFYLPGTQAGGLSSPLRTSLDCDICHSEPIYDTWRGSVMSQAGRDPLMWSALAVANAYAPNSGEICLRCHTNKGWLEGNSSPSSGSALTPDDIDNGVACLTCHRMVDPVASASDEARAIDALVRSALGPDMPPVTTSGSAMLIIDPNDNRRGPFSLPATFAYHSGLRSDLLGQTGSALTRARMCGGCHNVSNPLLSYVEGSGYLPNPPDERAPSFEDTATNRPFPLESTFDEWRLSAYANGGVYAPEFAGAKPGGVVETCQDCHMPRTTGTAADSAFNPIQRDCATTGCLPLHTFVGPNSWLPQLLQNPDWRLSPGSSTTLLNQSRARSEKFLRQAASLTVEMGSAEPGGRPVLVTVYNQTGHKLPTGYPEGRRMWIRLRAYDAADRLIAEFGEYDEQTGLLDVESTKVYEAKLGLSSAQASSLNLPAGESFFFALNNEWLKDNRIPPRGFSPAAYDRDGLRPIGADYAEGQYFDTTEFTVPAETDRVFVELYYQTASKEYIDFLRRYGGLDGDQLGQMWEATRGQPVRMARGWAPNFPSFAPVSPH